MQLASANEAMRQTAAEYRPRVMVSQDVGATLSTALTASATTVVLLTGPTVTVGSVLLFELEGMRVESVTVGATITCVVTRGYCGVAAAHDAGTPGLVYLDLSDKITHDRIRRVPGLRQSLEKGRGQAAVETGSLILDNRDRFFDALPPTGISSWNGRVVRVSLVTAGGGETPIGHYIITELQTATSNEATFTVEGLGKLLMRQDASMVLNGQSPWENVPAWWLVQQVLLQVFPKATVNSWVADGTLLAGYEIPLSDAYPVRAVSAYGNLADWDGTGIFGDRPQVPYGSPMCQVPTTGSPPNNLAGQTLVGVGSDLYARHPTTQAWTRLGGFGTLYPNHKIMHVWWDAVYNGYVGVGWEPDVPAYNQTNASHRSGAKNGVVTFFRGNGDAVGGVPTTNAFLVFAAPTNAHDGWDETTPEYITTGHFCYRAGNYASSGGQYTFGVGPNDIYSTDTGLSYTHNDALSFGINVPLPAGQWFQSGMTNSWLTGFACNKHVGWNTYAGLQDLHPSGSGGIRWENGGAGYFSFHVLTDAVHVDQRPLDYRFTLGQSQGCFALKNAGGQLAFCSIRWDSAAHIYKYKVWTLSTTSGTVSGANILTPTYTMRDSGALIGAFTAGGAMQPYALAFSPDDNHLAAVGAFWGEAAWSGGVPVANAVVGRVVEIHNTGAWAAMSSGETFATNTYTTTDLRNGYLPTHVTYTGTSGGQRYMMTGGLNYKGVGTGAQHLTMLLNSAGSTGYVRPSGGRPAGFCWDTDLNRVYWHESDTNIVVSLACTDLVGQPAIEDYGYHPVIDDPSLFAGLVYDAANKRLYGISGAGVGSQADPQTLDQPLSANNFFWQLANGLTDRVSLADFTDMTCWDALEQLRAFFDGVTAFLPDGRFYMQPRPTAATIGSRIKVKGYIAHDTYRFSSMTKKMGFADVVNYAAVNWSRKIIGAPTAQLTLVPRDANIGRDATTTKPIPVVVNSRRQQMLLRCVRGGYLGYPDAGCMRRNAAGSVMMDTGTTSPSILRFAYLIVDRIVKSQLLLSISATGTVARVPLEAVRDVTPSTVSGFADSIEITDSVTNVTTNYQITAMTESPTGGYADLTLGIPAVAAYPVGTPIIVRTFKNNRWSDDPRGVTTLAASLNSTSTSVQVRSVKNLALYAMMSLENSSGREDMRVMAIDRTTNTVTVRRACGATLASTFSADTTVKAYLAPLQREQITAWPLGAAMADSALSFNVAQAYATNVDVGSTIIIDNEAMTLTAIGALSGGNYPFIVTRPKPVAHLQNAPVRVVNPMTPDTVFFMGDSGVGLRFETPDQDLPFLPGDIISITCPGASLQVQSDSPAIAWNEAARQRMNGRVVKWEAGADCKFFTDRVAWERAKAVVADDGYGKGHFLISAEGPMVMAQPPLLGEAAGFEDVDLFPALSGGSPNGDNPAVVPDQKQGAGTFPTLAGMIYGYEIDLDNARVRIDARAINPHPL